MDVLVRELRMKTLKLIGLIRALGTKLVRVSLVFSISGDLAYYADLIQPQCPISTYQPVEGYRFFKEPLWLN